MNVLVQRMKTVVLVKNVLVKLVFIKKAVWFVEKHAVILQRILVAEKHVAH